MLWIKSSIYEMMVAHMRAVYPLEGCGLLAGVNGRVTHLYTIDNILQSHTAFEMDPLQQVKVMLHIEAQGFDLLAMYHSHPRGPATPSPTDIAHAYYPDTSQLIISLQNLDQPIVRAFTIIDGCVQEHQLIIE